MSSRNDGLEEQVSSHVKTNDLTVQVNTEYLTKKMRDKQGRQQLAYIVLKMEHSRT
jgi:uncharacterized protein affecting Mg2+/Co2+ transport